MGTKGTTISKHLKEWNIKIRGNSESKLGFDIDIYSEDIIKLYKNGFTIKNISEKYNVSSPTISRILKNNNIKIVKNNEKDERIDCMKNKIIELYISGVSIKEISKMLNIGKTTIRSRLKQWGIHIKSNSEIQLGFDINIYKDKIIYMYTHDKIGMKKIGKMFNVNESVIKRILVENNIPINKRKGK